MRIAMPLLAILLGTGCKSPNDLDATLPTTEPTGPREDAPFYEADHLVEVSIDMSPVDFVELRLQTRDILDVLSGDCLAEPAQRPYSYFEASVTIDGQQVDNVGVRKKGFIGSLSFDKPGLKIKFDEYDDDLRLAGMTRFTLNNNVQDPALIRQCLGYKIFADAGIPAPRCNFAHVTVNGEDLGVYTHVEAVKTDFLTQHFGNATGDLYEGTLSDFRTDWLGTFDPKTRSSDTGKAPLMALATALEQPDATLLDSLEPLLDIDAFLTFYAAEVLIGHWDGYAGNTNNFFAYFDPSDGRLRMIPWGIDGTFGETLPFGPDNPVSVVAEGALAQRIYQHPDMTDAYLDRLNSLLDTAWDEGELLAEADRMSALIAPFAADLDYVTEAQEEVRVYLSDRRDAIVDATATGPETWDRELKATPCLIDQGPITMSFAATWETLESADPLAEGMSQVDMSWDGEVLPTMTGSAIAGTFEPGQGAVVGIVIDGLTLWQPIAVFATEDMAPNTVLPLDLVSNTLGILNWQDLTTMAEAETVGYILDGELTFEQAQDTPGAPIVGTLNARTWGF